MNRFVETITSSDPNIRDRPFSELCEGMSAEDLLEACHELETFRSQAENLYDRVRASLFLFAAHRFYLTESSGVTHSGEIPYAGYTDLLSRRFEEALSIFLSSIQDTRPNGTICSALAETYHQLAFQALADQVRRSVRASRGNQWMFRVSHSVDHPLQIRRELLERPGNGTLYPILRETTPVRLDLSHSGWSDIFFLGMDYPEGARVLNISVDLGVYGRDREIQPPIETYIRVIPEPLLRLTSIDLEATKDVSDLSDLFNFGNDYLSLLKAGVIASGLIPPSFEGTNQTIEDILGSVVGPGLGLELVTQVNDIPKGSRLAVSTNLLASIIAALMRATSQTASLEGGLGEQERRLAASRAILGEWLGGSGGGWQDSGGIWPGLKVITGAAAEPGDPEYGISKGCLLPRHRLLGEEDIHPEMPERLANSLVLIHGGMAQNVGPILEMVTEKYLLRGKIEWEARQALHGIFEDILKALANGDVKALAASTTRNFTGPLRTIIPWVTNHFTETIIERASKRFGPDFWGFLMLGGMSGGGMAMFVRPEQQAKFRNEILDIMTETKRELEDAIPFAMDPVVYDFRTNHEGSVARLRIGEDAVMPIRYHALQIPEMVRQERASISSTRRAELDHVTSQVRDSGDTHRLLRSLVTSLLSADDPAGQSERQAWDAEVSRVKAEYGFDSVQHEQIRSDLRAGRIGLAHNRLPVETEIEDVRDTDVTWLDSDSKDDARLGEKALQDGRVAVLSLAGGVGSRWTTGAGVVKAVNPFIWLAGKHRTFLEIHLAKTRRAAKEYGAALPHIVSTSFLTHQAIEKHLALNDSYGFSGPLYLSPGRAIGQRLIPMVRDLLFLWEEMPQEILDEQKQKVREAVRGALMEWARSKGEASDYVDNIPLQRLSPLGHWYEVPNLLSNGVLARLLDEHPKVDTIMLHNIDTLGADLNPRALGHHLRTENELTFEVVPRRIVDRGGGLARVNGQVRLLEGLAQPREQDELRLRFYNSMTTWIEVDAFLARFGLERKDLSGSPEQITAAVRRMARRMPTYVTIKDVKRRWGHGQEDVFPVAQFEKLWSDMTALPDISCGFLAVDRLRGQQLKDPDQLDPWANDGSKEYVARLCDF